MEVGSAPPPALSGCIPSSSVPNYSRAAPPGSLIHLARFSKPKSTSWKPVQAAGMGNGSPAGGLGQRGESDGNILEDVSALLASCEQLKTMVDSSSSSGVGIDMRNRVDHLFKRVRILKQNAERAGRVAGGRVPSQLIASFKILQREHGSVENIVRLATQAGPVLSKEQLHESEITVGSIAAQKSSLPLNNEITALELPQRGQENGTCVEVLSGPKYVMSTPLSQGSFKLNVVRAEIERRVMEQLSRNPGQFDSKEDVLEGSDSNWQFQKVPVVNQRILEEEKTNVDTAAHTDKGLLPQIGDAHLSDKLESEVGTNKESFESAKTILLELHEQMCKRFDKSVSDLREEYLTLNNDAKEREDALLAFKRRVIGEQQKLLEKINELSVEVSKRETGEQSSSALKKMVCDMDEDMKRIQSQLGSLGSDIDMKGKLLEGWHHRQEQIRREFQAGISRLENRFNQTENMLEEFKPQLVLAELGNVRISLTALQEGELHEKTMLAGWQTKLEEMERSLSSNSQRLQMLNSEVLSRGKEGESGNALSKVLDDLEVQRKEWREYLQSVYTEQMKSASYLEVLREEWKTHRRELQLQIQDMRDRLMTLEKTQNQCLMMEISSIKGKLNGLQEEHNHERSLISEVQRQMFVLEEKGLDLLRTMNETAEIQKRDLLEEIRAVVEGLLQTAHVSNKDTNQESLSHQQEVNANSDVGYVRNLIQSSSSYSSDSELSPVASKNNQHMANTQLPSPQVPDKGTASLEAFFSVMGHLIREELKKRDGISAQNLPHVDPQQSKESDHFILANPSSNNSVGMENGQIILLRYDSSWRKAFIHYCADNLRWTEAPGVTMHEMSNPEQTHWKEFRIDASRLEFVMTDGQGNWDRAPNGQNYLVERPGIFELRAGVLKAASSL